MVTTDPIADMLTRIRNANDAYHDKVDMPASKMKAAVLAILKDEGFVKSVEQIEVEGHPELRVALKYGITVALFGRNAGEILVFQVDLPCVNAFKPGDQA